ncbi:kinesin-like protein KIN-7F [Malania oleifera]|uniref:kinesin-like protein KIN-7F n=1 Tax=Malania oleifera TaxID=397392 RepID=UPI0025AE7C11|nr:kinesin-like protein KIN-7F [Malania oleifera]
MGASGGEELTLQGGSSGHEEKIFVSVRIRPLSEKEIAKNDVSDWDCINNNTVMFKNSLPERSMLPNAYNFDRVFGCDCSTKVVYEEGAKKVALSVVNGINTSIFAYGQTSSGKTYTMSGITECTVADIYDCIQRHKSREFVLKFSAMEIYNEAVRDLLSSDSTPLRLLDDPERGTVVERLTEETLRDEHHLMELLSICEAQRQIGETSLNETSSRSHQILRLTVESSAREFLSANKPSTLSATVNFVDLAGSERASQTLSAGARLKEGCHINRSLLTLGTVIRKLSKGRNGHVPYRDSKLTRILQNSLGGNARTAIICTMSPARSHVEQSRNTLLFASCAKEVATNAHVNVVMSDKALVKHLQRELARMESELKSLGSPSAIGDSAALLKEKEIQIEKMNKEIQELTKQRDLAQSQAEDFLQSLGVDKVSRPWAESNQPLDPQVQNAWRDEYSASESSDATDFSRLDGDMRTFNISQCPQRLPHLNSNRDYVQFPENSEANFLFDGTSPRLLLTTPRFLNSDPYQCWEEIPQRMDEDSEDLCKEVRCIEPEEQSTNKNIETDPLSPGTEEKGGNLAPMLTGDESALSALKGDEEMNHMHSDHIYDALKQKIQDMQRTIDHLVSVYPADQSPCSTEADLSSCQSMKLTRSRSCRAVFDSSPSSPWFYRAEQGEKTPPDGFEKDFPGRPELFQLRPTGLKHSADTENFSRKNSEASIQSVSAEEKVENTKTSYEEVTTDIYNSTQGTNKLAKPQERVVKTDELEESVKGTGFEKVQDANPQSPSNWPAEFERQRREIIELWDACYVPLVHRTYFFQLFIGEPSDSVYMEVELRRLSFLKDKFSDGSKTVKDCQTLTLASSRRALNREREMLSKQVMKRFSQKERNDLYQSWGIGLGTKRRRLQLARRLWTNTKDMEHVKESAALVAKLAGFLLPDKASKEMFGLSFSPRPLNHRSYSWKNMSALL